MEIYTLDANYKRYDVVDKFDSFIWTERYNDVGDFEIVTNDTPQNRSRFRDGTCLTHTLTDRIMIVESRFRSTDDQGRTTLKVKGPSIDAVLDSRAVVPRNTGEATWNATETAGWIATRLVADIMVSGTGLTTDDVIPELYIADTTGETTHISAAVKLGSVLDAVKNLCDSRRLGFRIQLMPTSPKLRFNVFKGRDLRDVVFSSSLDNITEESHLHDISDYKNIAYVWGKDAAAYDIVPAPNHSVYRQGLMRKVLHVDASDIDSTESTLEVYKDQLKQRGLEELSKHNKIDVFDAKLTGLDPYTYRYEYSLGDVVTMMDASNRKHETIIQEYIWAWDSEGLRSYPTFVATDEWTV